MASPTSSNNSSLWARQPSLEQLVAHFVASKRSLSAAAHVQRAHDIVQAARGSLEESAALGARNSFVRRALAEQARGLEAVHQGIEQVGIEVQDEFTELLHTLDETDAQLQATVTVLRNTPVEPSLQQSLPTSQSPGSSSTSSVHVPPAPKHLYDFVDDAASAGLHATLRACIDRYNAAHSSLAETADALYAKLSEINSTVFGSKGLSPVSSSRSLSRSADSSNSTRQHKEQQHPPSQNSLPSIFRALESHATEAADLLQSLVSHYDLCVTALKHTEGGDEAAAAELGLAVGEGSAQAVLQRSGEDQEAEAPPPPLTEEERADMMAVLDKDAAEVDDVVSEIRDRLSEMESLLSTLQSATDARRTKQADLLRAARSLRALVHTGDDGTTGIGASIAVEAAAVFSLTWETERMRIVEARGELQGLAEFYEGFAAAYDDLLVEVARRAEVQKKVEKVAKDAMAKVEKILKEEVQTRERFRAEQGDFLPSDIWPGLVDPPPKYELHATDKAGAVPRVPREVLQQALERIHERG